MKYRSSGDPDWRDAHTENISRSGVLFRADHVLPVQTLIEMLLALPVEIAGDDDATVICRGRVVRMDPPPRGQDQRPALAATIAGYRLTHSQGSDPRRI